ncbi:hypothetical protein BN2476_230179 [Paraburkholderia piptadeniae]|uniref:Uncharacterized protein n=1 Tax=Paraburkholderia piptadeniae TaxID=1701573 RepID=A0A1N7RX75_9BURK|nr:hypothetical protein BN2476_230179 [Paraburkholderia piptadeniae]
MASLAAMLYRSMQAGNFLEFCRHAQHAILNRTRTKRPTIPRGPRPAHSRSQCETTLSAVPTNRFAR